MATKAGAALYDKNCSGCHGNKGEGAIDGPALKSDAAKKASDGELFWFITHGNPANGMPAWESTAGNAALATRRFRARRSIGQCAKAAATSSNEPVARPRRRMRRSPTYRYESPGTVRKITVDDLPKPFATQSVQQRRASW